MRGLMLNNLHLLRRNSVFFYLLFLLVGLSVSALSYLGVFDLGHLTPVVFLMTVATVPMISLEVVGHAINAKWDIFQKAMPVRKGTIIASHYVTYILLSAAALGLWLLLPFEHGDRSNLIQVMLGVQLVCVIYYPVQYLLNVLSPKNESTGQFLLIIAAVLAFASVVPFATLTEEHNELAAAIILSIALYALSFALSVFFDGLSRKGGKRKLEVRG